jgi:hypothetical protein
MATTENTTPAVSVPSTRCSFMTTAPAAAVLAGGTAALPAPLVAAEPSRALAELWRELRVVMHEVDELWEAGVPVEDPVFESFHKRQLSIVRQILETEPRSLADVEIQLRALAAHSNYELVGNWRYGGLEAVLEGMADHLERLAAAA